MNLAKMIINHFDLEHVIGKGMFSVVTQHTGMSVYKYTACPSYQSFIELPVEDIENAPYFIRGNYVKSEYVEDYIVNVYELPLLHRFNITELPNKQKKFIHEWKAFVKRSHFLWNQATYTKRTRWQLDLAAEANITFAKYNKMLGINMQNLILSFDPWTKLDGKFKDSIMLDSNGQLVISDPVFSMKLANELRSK